MAGRRTNLALFLLMASALGTGTLTYAFGRSWALWVVAAHGAVGFGMVVLAPWKSVIARRGLHRGRPGSGISIAFSVLVAATLATGIGHSTGVLRTMGPVTAMQLHVTAAILAIPFGVWHVVVRRVRWARSDISRRNLLRTGALALGSVAVYGGVTGLTRAAGLPGRGRRFTGSYEQGSLDPSRMPVTQWLDDSVPVIEAEGWSVALLAHGRVLDRRSMADLDRVRQPVEAVIDCTGGWFARQVWEGVPLERLLASAGDPHGRSIQVGSATGYGRRFPRTDGSALWLATRVGGEPLSPGHGSPARLVAPGRRGFWWVKWVTSIEVADTPWWWQPPFPVT